MIFKDFAMDELGSQHGLLRQHSLAADVFLHVQCLLPQARVCRDTSLQVGVRGE